MTTLYGIPNCDTVRRARRWLDDAGVAYRFHDLRRDGLDGELLGSWIDALGWEAVLNRAGTTFRRLPEDERADLNRRSAAALMLAHPAMVKRPVLVAAGGVTLGFDPERYAALFAGARTPG